jgi:hypothetical protein
MPTFGASIAQVYAWRGEKDKALNGLSVRTKGMTVA